MQLRPLRLPRRLLLIRHGESEANVNPAVYSTTPDWRIGLTARGRQQAFECGRRLRQLVQEEKVYLYYSPYHRARQTLEELRRSLSPGQILGQCEDERLREQEIGNYQPLDQMDRIWDERNRYGRLYYRFPGGESGADVGDRVSCFFNALLRMSQGLAVPSMNTRDGEAAAGQDFPPRPAVPPSPAGSSPPNARGGTPGAGLAPDQNVVVVSHGLLIRLFLSRWFGIPVEWIDALTNPANCAIVELVRAPGGERLILTQASKALFGDDPRLQEIHFDGQEGVRGYARPFSPSARERGGGAGDDMGRYF